MNFCTECGFDRRKLPPETMCPRCNPTCTNEKCGADLSEVPTAKFCPNCGTATLKPDDADENVSKTATLNADDPWPIGLSISMEDAWDSFAERYCSGDELPAALGVFIIMEAKIEASINWSSERSCETLNNWTRDQGPPPFNLALDQQSDEPKPWRDAMGNLVCRAASIAYYNFGVGLAKKWHLARPLRASSPGSTVTVDLNRMDFELQLKGDMTQEKFLKRMRECFMKLNSSFEDGIHTKSTIIHAVGPIQAAAIYPWE